MLTGKAVAQSVTVDATIDSLQIYIGDHERSLHLVLHTFYGERH